MRLRYTMRSHDLRPDITPLIDVIFLLLIFFMLGSQFVYTTSIKVKLPNASTGQSRVEKDIMTVSVAKNGEVFIDGRFIEFDDLNKVFKEMGSQKVAISADKEAQFQDVIRVWDAARKNKLSEIQIQTNGQ